MSTAARAVHRLASRVSTLNLRPKPARHASRPTPSAGGHATRRRALGLALTPLIIASSSSAASGSNAMPVTYPKPIVVPPPEGGATTAVCIFLHGLGDTGHGWADVASSMPFEGVKWIFPTAPTIPITLNGGMRMTGWYDINDLSTDNIKDDRAQTLASTEYVQGLIKAEIDGGVNADRIVVGGFSQGGVIALQTALRFPERLAGAVGMSTYLALREDFPDAMSPHAKDLPVFLAHGTADMVLQYQYGVMSSELMTDTLGMTKVDFQTYQGMGHSACQEELQQLAKFIANVLD